MEQFAESIHNGEYVWQLILDFNNRVVVSRLMEESPTLDECKSIATMFKADGYVLKKVVPMSREDGGCYFCEAYSPGLLRHVAANELEEFVHITCLKEQLSTQEPSRKAEELAYLLELEEQW
jgi:hypothetical protein